ncbi:hypothetical protein M885DRAFT_512299 [Pelagophyceae sp. CCMP2097]|nr:hypothetical protein M885DRAFT_512299 [Pelagophyceae sp. CCMP2097]
MQDVLTQLAALGDGSARGSLQARRHLAKVSNLLDDKGVALSKALDVPPPAADKRQRVASGGALKLHNGQDQQIQPQLGRAIVTLSDELQLDEEIALDLLARMSERGKRRQLSRALGLGECGLDEDIVDAARRLFYFEAECAVQALLETVKGALDGRLDADLRRMLRGHVKRLSRGSAGAVPAEPLCAAVLRGVRGLCGGGWATSAQRRDAAAKLSATAAEALFYAFYDVQLFPQECASVLRLVLDVSRLVDDAAMVRQRAKKPRSSSPVGFLGAGYAAAAPVQNAQKVDQSRDVLLLLVVQALDATARFRSREDGDAAGGGDEDDFEANQLAAMGCSDDVANAVQPQAGAPNEGPSQRGARGVAVLAWALVVARRAAETNDEAAEARALVALREAFDLGCCTFLCRAHSLLRCGALREPQGGRAPTVYLAALAELVIALLETLYHFEVLPARDGATHTADGLDELVELVRSLAEAHPKVCDRFFDVEGGDDGALAKAPTAAQFFSMLGDKARHDDAARVPYIRALATLARGGAAAAAQVRELLRADGDAATHKALAPPPPGYSWSAFFSHVDRYGEVLRASELEVLQERQRPSASAYYGEEGETVARPAERLALWLSPKDADALAAICDVVANVARPSAAHVDLLCEASTDRASQTLGDLHALGQQRAPQLASSLLRLYARAADAVPLDLKAACLRAVAALCQADEVAKAVGLLWDHFKVLSEVPKTEFVLPAAPAMMRYPRSLKVAEAQPAPVPRQLDPWSPQAAPPIDGRVQHRRARYTDVVSDSRYSAAAARGVAERDVDGAESRLRTYSATDAVLVCGAELLKRKSLAAPAARALVRFALRDVLLRCASRQEVSTLVFAHSDERWKLAARALDCLGTALDAYGADSDAWKADFNAKEPTQDDAVSAGFEIFYDATTQGGGLLQSCVELLSEARKGEAEAAAADDDDEDDEAPPAAGEAAQLRWALDARARLESARESERGAGTAWWRAQAEKAALSLLGRVADHEAAFVGACRRALATNLAAGATRAARALVSGARGAPRTLSEQVSLSFFDAVKPDAVKPDAEERVMGMDAAREAVATLPFFATSISSLVSELALRVAPLPAHREKSAADAVALLRHVARNSDAARLKTALQRDDGVRGALAARLASARRVVDCADCGATSRDADLYAPAVSTAGDLVALTETLDLIAECSARGGPSSVGHWLLGLDANAETSAARIAYDAQVVESAGCLGDVVHLAFDSLGFPDSDSAPHSLAEPAWELLYQLAKAPATSAATVDAVAAFDGGRGLSWALGRAARLVLAGRAVAGARTARAVLDCVAVAAYAAQRPYAFQPPQSDLSDRTRARAAQMLDELTRVGADGLGGPAEADDATGCPRLAAALLRAAVALASDADDGTALPPPDDVALRQIANDCFYKQKEADSLTACHDVVDVSLLLKKLAQQPAAVNADAVLDAATEKRRSMLLDWARQANAANDRRCAAVGLADAVAKLLTVALGYAHGAASLCAPREQAPATKRLMLLEDEAGSDGEDDALDALSAPRAVIRGVALAALAALASQRRCDARAGEALAKVAADAVANLRSLAVLNADHADSAWQRRETARLARAIGAALADRDVTSEALRGHLHVALAHALSRDSAPQGRAAGLDDDVCPPQVWRRVGADAASAATPWVRLAAAAALCGAIRCSEAAARHALSAGEHDILDAVLKRPQSNDAAWDAVEQEQTEELASAELESALGALVRLAARRAGAVALVDRDVVVALARNERLHSRGVSRAVLLALELVRELVATLPRHARLCRDARRFVGGLLSRSDRELDALLDASAPLTSFSAMRARAAMVGILAVCATAPPGDAGDDDAYASEAWAAASASHQASYAPRLWALLAQASAERAVLPGWRSPPAAGGAAFAKRYDEESEAAPLPQWASISPTTPAERERHLVARQRGWTAFDDDKLNVAALTWTRLVDAARRLDAREGTFDLDAVVATIRKASALSWADETDSDDLAAVRLRRASLFVLEAALVALYDHFAKAAKPAEKRQAKAKVLHLMDQHVPPLNDFISRLKKQVSLLLE